MGEDMAAKIDEANRRAIEAMISAQTVWVDIKPAIKAVPGMRENIILHSGPPIEWAIMCQPHRNGVVGGMLHEGLASTQEEAIKLVEKGEVEIASSLDYKVVGPGAGITTASMPVYVAKEANSAKEGYCIPFEAFRSLRAWGSYDTDIENHLKWQENVFTPVLSAMLKETGGLNIKSIIAAGTLMGDESHTRQVAECALAKSEIISRLIKADIDRETMIQVADYFNKRERFFHSISMAGAMATLEAAMGIEHSTVVTVMGGNGVEFGIKCSSLGDQWFAAPAPMLEGTYLSPQWGPEDAVPYLGDSCVVEAVGLGAFAAAAGPAVLRLRGGTIEDAIRQTGEMRQISVGTNNEYPIPLLNFKGPPIGIDIRKVLETGIAPLSHGGILSKKGGQIGAGVARLPMECFKKALYAFAEKYGLL